MPEIITVTNQKGGVGKTTVAAALVCGLHQRGARALGIDLDPQGNLAFALAWILDAVILFMMCSLAPLRFKRP